MKPTDIPQLPIYFDRYIQKIGDIELGEALTRGLTDLEFLTPQMLRLLGTATYAPGKWNVLDILQHMADAERIFAYRALRFARGDRTELKGFDQDTYARSADAAQRPPGALLEELREVRRSTRALFESFDQQMLLRDGVCNGVHISVLALGFTAAGHWLHHLEVIQNKYLPLLPTS